MMQTNNTMLSTFNAYSALDDDFEMDVRGMPSTTVHVGVTPDVIMRIVAPSNKVLGDIISDNSVIIMSWGTYSIIEKHGIKHTFVPVVVGGVPDWTVNVWHSSSIHTLMRDYKALLSGRDIHVLLDDSIEGVHGIEVHSIVTYSKGMSIKHLEIVRGLIEGYYENKIPLQINTDNGTYNVMVYHKDVVDDAP